MHATHGISRYMGTRFLEAEDGTTTQYFQLDYAEGDRVFVPVEHVGRLSKHVGTDVTPARLSVEFQHRTSFSRLPKPH